MTFARAWTVLMAELGYDRYGVQGGDWGAVRWTSYPHGGHFAAREQAAVFVGDVRAFFMSLS
jgi:hypothetical protein